MPGPCCCTAGDSNAQVWDNSLPNQAREILLQVLKSKYIAHFVNLTSSLALFASRQKFITLNSIFFVQKNNFEMVLVFMHRGDMYFQVKKKSWLMPKTCRILRKSICYTLYFIWCPNQAKLSMYVHWVLFRFQCL